MAGNGPTGSVGEGGLAPGMGSSIVREEGTGAELAPVGERGRTGP